MQRKLERAIRKQKKRVLVAEATGDKEKLLTDQIKLQRYRQEYSRFSKAAGLRTEDERLFVSGFGRKQAAKPSSKTNAPAVEKTPQSAIMGKTVVEENVVHKVGTIDIDKYRGVSKEILTDEVVITDERIEHIKEHHPNDYERFSGYLAEIVRSPDYIIEDSRPNTAMVMKTVVESGEHFRLALRLVTPGDNPNYKNSIITFLKIREKEWQRLIKNKNILYKSE